MLRGNLHAYMDMIRHQVAFNDPAFLLTCQLMEDGPQGFPNVAIHGLPAPLGDKYDVIIAIPPRMRQALIGVRHGVLLRCALIRPPEEHSTPGSLKALHVSLAKPVAYLKDRVTRNAPSPLSQSGPARRCVAPAVYAICAHASARPQLHGTRRVRGSRRPA